MKGVVYGLGRTKRVGFNAFGARSPDILACNVKTLCFAKYVEPTMTRERALVPKQTAPIV